MAWLCRLVTPPGGTILDCFMGSGSTLIAAERGNFGWVGIDASAAYCAIAQARLATLGIQVPIIEGQSEEEVS
jgi:site-specific DNA-methyltransferase (adenine-specific)